jgi:hypothetical protein
LQLNHSSTQVPFVLAAFIAVMIHNVVSEPNGEAKLNVATKENQVLKTDLAASETIHGKKAQ